MPLLIVNSLPDSAKFTSDCSKLVIAVEGLVHNVGGTVVDPEGGVMVADFGQQGPDADIIPSNTFVDFTSYNNVWAVFDHVKYLQELCICVWNSSIIEFDITTYT